YAAVGVVPGAGCVEEVTAIYQSTDTGVSWRLVSDAAMNAMLTVNTAVVKISVGPSHNVYVGIVNNGRLAGLFHSPDGARTWTLLDQPPVNSSSATHFSIGADARNPNLVYIGGQQSAGSALVFRVDASKATGSQVETETDAGTAKDTSPHADSRDM